MTSHHRKPSIANPADESSARQRLATVSPLTLRPLSYRYVRTARTVEGAPRFVGRSSSLSATSSATP
jgi:hypothetical protein